MDDFRAALHFFDVHPAKEIKSVERVVERPGLQRGEMSCVRERERERKKGERKIQTDDRKIDNWTQAHTFGCMWSVSMRSSHSISSTNQAVLKLALKLHPIGALINAKAIVLSIRKLSIITGIILGGGGGGKNSASGSKESMGVFCCYH